MAYDNDPLEFTGTTNAIKAEPVRSGTDKPAPSVAVYTPPKPGASHPKHAVLGPAKRLDAAEAALTATELEKRNAMVALREAELAETAAHHALLAVLPKPSADEVYRAHIAREQAEKVARVAQGLPPVEPPKPMHGKSPADLAALNRPRNSPQNANAPLRSAIPRRKV